MEWHEWHPFILEDFWPLFAGPAVDVDWLPVHVHQPHHLLLVEAGLGPGAHLRAHQYNILLQMSDRPGWTPQPLSGTLDDQLPSMWGDHGLKDFLCSAHLLESFEWRIYTYGSVLKSKFVTQRTQEDEHYRENPSIHELLTLRGVDRRG